MPVRRFLDRLSDGAPAERGEIVQAVTRVFLEAPLDPDNRAAAITAMTLILDDPAPRVRRALAEGLADAAEAPRPIMLTLANDQADIAVIVLSRSPVLTDSDLIDIAGSSGERQRTAIAQRPVVSVGLAAALAEISEVETCHALITNPGAEITLPTFRRLIERHRKAAALRNALLERNDLPPILRDGLIAGLSEALGDLVRLHEWLSPQRADSMFREAREQAIVDLASATDQVHLRPLIEWLAAEGRLAPALIIRAACAGNSQFFEEALSVISAMPRQRVVALVHDRSDAGFAALYRRAGLPASAKPAFRAICGALRDLKDIGDSCCGFGIVEAVLSRYSRQDTGGADHYLALISRLAADASREAARAQTGGYFRAA